MKYFTLSIVLLFIVLNSLAQNSLGIDTTILGGQEQSIYRERYILMNQTNDKYIIGTFKGSYTIENISISTNLNLPTEMCRGFYLAKFDSSNNFKWLKKICESDSIFLPTVSIDDSSNILLGIMYRSTLYKFNDTILNNNGLGDVMILKIDSSGNEIYSKIISTPCFESIFSVNFDKYQNLYFTGQLDVNLNSCTTLFDTISILNTGVSYLAKLDKNGNYNWVKVINVPEIDKVYCRDDKVFLMGQCSSLKDTIAGIPIQYSPPYYSKCFIAKLDSSGNGLWVRKFGSNDIQSAGVHPNSISVKNNRVYFTGGAFSNNQNVFLFDGGPTLYGNLNKDYFIASYDTSGNFVWNTISSSIGDEFISQLTTDSMSNVYGVGSYDYTLKFPTDTIYSQGSEDVFVCSYDSMGTFKWVIHGGGGGSDIGSGITSDTHGKLFIVGGTTSAACYMGNDTLYPSIGQSTMFFSSLDSIELHAPNAIVNYAFDKLLKIYPNPADEKISLETSTDQSQTAFATIQLRNTMGNVVYHSTISTKSFPISVDVSRYTNGLYFLSYTNQQHTSTQKLIISSLAKSPVIIFSIQEIPTHIDHVSILPLVDSCGEEESS